MHWILARSSVSSALPPLRHAVPPSHCLLAHGTASAMRTAKLPGEDKYFAIKSIRKDHVIKHGMEKHLRNEKSILEVSEALCCRPCVMPWWRRVYWLSSFVLIPCQAYCAVTVLAALCCLRPPRSRLFPSLPLTLGPLQPRH